ncbi:hypothetical protein FQR65_LT08116 [Abscondita terminalis]|nr:hypothetical protein FQR65_LT08116 [Abscondita terminalis]
MSVRNCAITFTAWVHCCVKFIVPKFGISNTITADHQKLGTNLLDPFGKDKYDKMSNCELLYDLCNVQLKISSTDLNQVINLKDFSMDILQKDLGFEFEKSPYVCASLNDGKFAMIKKSSRCWLLEEDKEKISPDRLRRFIQNTQQPQNHMASQAEYGLKVGNWCLFKKPKAIELDDELIVARILAFCKLKGNKCTIKSPKQTKDTGCLCSWYQIDPCGSLILVNTDNHFVCEISNYIIKISNPEVNYKDEELYLKVTNETLEKLKTSSELETLDANKNLKKRKKKHDVDETSIAKVRILSTDSSTDTETDSSYMILDDSTDTEIFSNDDSEHNIELERKETNILQDSEKVCTNNCAEEADFSNIQIDDFIMTQLTSLKGNKMRYIGKIISVDPRKYSYLKTQK